MANNRAISPYVEDVAELCIKAANAPGVAGKMYNAGNGGRFTLNYLWDAAAENGRRRPSRRSTGRRAQGDVRHSMADTTAAAAELGHAPRFTIEEGLKKTLEWYRQTAGVPA